MIRRNEMRIPALGSAVKLLLEIHGLDARHVRNYKGEPYYWLVEKPGPNSTKTRCFEIPVKATLEDWQHKCSRPGDWSNALTLDYENFSNGWSTSLDEYAKIDAKAIANLHARYKRVWAGADFSGIESRVAAHYSYTAQESDGAERPVRKEGPG